MTLKASRFAGDERLQRASTNSPPLRKGESGDAVRILQQALVDLGHPMPVTTAHGGKPPDGIYGDETARVVREFQAKSGLQADGIAGRDTLARLDEIFASHDARAMILSAAAVVDAGHRLLREPGAMNRLVGDHATLRSQLRDLEAALAKHRPPDAPAHSQSFAPSPTATPASFRGGPVLGFVGVDDATILLILLLFAAASAAVSAGQAGQPPPKITHQDLFRPLESILALALGLSASEATKLRELIRDIINRIKECMEKHPERVEVCAEFIARFNDVSGQLLQKLTRLIHDMGTLGPIGVTQTIRAIEALRQELIKVLESLIDCLGCDNFLKGKQSA